MTRPAQVNGRRQPEVALRMGDWVFDPSTQQLRRGDDLHTLNPKEAAVLARLVETAPGLVTSQALLEEVWADVVVGDHVLHEVIGRLRKMLGESARNPRYIETLPRRGYRLKVAVEPISSRQLTGTRPRGSLARLAHPRTEEHDHQSRCRAGRKKPQ